MTQYVLDSWALVCWFRNEPAAPRVTEMFNAARQRSCMLSINVINLGETLYSLARYRGILQARQDIAVMRDRWHVLPASEDLVMRAAAFKAAHKISYADGFAVATALELDAPLVTGDPEIGALARTLPQLQLHWLEN